LRFGANLAPSRNLALFVKKGMARIAVELVLSDQRKNAR
jgi:hypothetical protein